MIQGISHITLIVRDLEKTARLFKDIFGAEETYSSGDDTHSHSREKFFSIQGVWFAIMEGNPLSEKTYNHIAFSIPDNEFDGYSKKIADFGLETMKDRKRIPGEGRSVYFYDYDNHLFELHAGTLEERLKKYKK